MSRLLIVCILVVFTQLFAIIMWGEYVWLYKFANGGVGGTPLGQVQVIFWWILIIEILLFLFFFSSIKKEKANL